MSLQDVYKTLKNEYNSGIFFLEDDKIGWVYNNEGVDTHEAAEDRWLSFLGAKLTAQNIIGEQFEIYEKFDCNHKIGFFIREII
ncbi:hypothetical protein Bp8pS_008 [Bacillus phage vB_BpuM-BpSp]|nr:hypothetical protein Bp8pS_008 [Bacillus phage vB_BpuM-BpSp]